MYNYHSPNELSKNWKPKKAVSTSTKYVLLQCVVCTFTFCVYNTILYNYRGTL